ncbi:hypothetical protein ABID14_001681 [Peptoniphilus olsenii]|uniref:Uncharacterized protein n=1 Tax=Peptoniphilus olsenii TaxID=411570 RepID=A0ABV2JB92_9FIRM
MVARRKESGHSAFAARPPFLSFERRIRWQYRKYLLKRFFNYSYRAATLQVDSSTPNPSGSPLGITVVGVVVALSNVISTKKLCKYINIFSCGKESLSMLIESVVKE